jgi:N-acetylneuraminic acid mutarotase
LLPGGKVLVAGGHIGPTHLAGAELYDPRTHSWSAAAPMSMARTGHTATLLPNGKVLVAGGLADFYTETAELYDPASNSWSPAGSMSTYRYFHTATLLPSGKVLVAGGALEAGFLKRAELYNPATNSWSSAGSMTTDRSGHTATLLAGGKVLVTGGDSGDGPQFHFLASTELYSPATNTWSSAGSMAATRVNSTATLLPSAKVLVAGGDVDGTAELYAPTTQRWSRAASMSSDRYVHTATLLRGGRVLVAGGDGPAGSAQLYGPTTNSWSPAGSMSTPRASHSATLLRDGDVLIAGGDTPAGATRSVELYHPPRRARVGRIRIKHPNKNATKRRTRIGLRCVGKRGARCKGKLWLRPTKRRIRRSAGRRGAKVRFSLKAGQEKTFRVRLPKKTRAELARRHKALVRAVVRLNNGKTYKRLLTVHD